MITFDEAADILDELAEEIPKEFYRDLNGGVYLLPEVKASPRSREGAPLYILGEYIRRNDLGSYINIYYGSFARVFSHMPRDRLRKELRRVLVHEFTHHVECLAGERGLIIKDEAQMEKYLRKR